MKISASEAARAQAAQQFNRSPGTLPPHDSRHAERTDADHRSDQVQRSNPGEGMSPSERTAAYADRIHERLAALAERTGLDLSAIEREFDKNVDRIQAALADGTLDARGLAHSLGATTDIVKHDVKAALAADRGFAGQGLEGGDEQTTAARVEALSESINERFAALVAELDGASVEGLEIAQERFEGHVDRLLNALANGELSGEALEQGVKNILDLARSDVQRSLALSEVPDGQQAPVDGSTEASTAEARLDALADKVDQRFENLDTSGMSAEQLAELRDLKAGFESAMERLSDATFEQGAIGREQLGEILGDIFDALKEDMAGLFGSPADGATLYHPVTGVEDLAGGVLPELDQTA